MTNVRWVVQDNLISEKDMSELRKACEDLGVCFENVWVMPFVKELPEFTLDEKRNIYYGSTTFIQNLYEQLDKPKGVFFDPVAFSMENYIQKWGRYLLNGEGKITTIGDFLKEDKLPESQWFIRPDADDKSFDGQVQTFDIIRRWFTKVVSMNDSINVNEHTRILVSEPYNLKKEWRNFIVDGKIVTSSLYRKGFHLKKSRNGIPEEMLSFVEERCREYMPHRSFAMDVALCGDEYYILECGCLNSVGFYDADISVLVEALTKFVAEADR